MTSLRAPSQSVNYRNLDSIRQFNELSLGEIRQSAKRPFKIYNVTPLVLDRLGY